MRTVELLPDEAADRAVRESWHRLAGAGLPSQAAHTHPTNRPHLTLATAGTLPEEVRGRLAEALEALPVPLVVAGLVRFPGRVHVLAWAVRPDPALLALHTAVWRALASVPAAGRLNPLHAPGRWVPHLTLGRSRRPVWDDRPDEELLSALLPAAPHEAPRGRFTAARSYDSATRTTVPLAG
ncbi:2'-5' RNA ligase family protein [Streptomyces sp. TRM 70361]|uniref:2'-5' RNA ligase family protein n=1 Tax=Streptomyces sp. TRM 70361 TaxID=3116553 RepID=UPI002E7BB5BA|nr:2'-5' RNA ligase family protein [Streptomyces sp. TRM 70361]MEE1943193.1 2'-5' RNA ligase family protein [Streptomyces sp. TRM 70361]